jgi:hypothetical protein
MSRVAAAVLCVVVSASVSRAQVGALNAPQTLVVTVTGSAVTLAWQPPGDEQPTSYIIEAGTGPGASNLASFDTGSTATTFFAPFVPSGTYYVRVRARRGSTVGPPTADAVFTIGGGPAPCTGPPGAPRSLQVQVSGNTVAFTWTPPASGAVTGYVILAGSFAGGSNLAIVDTASAATSFSAVAPAGTYYVRVLAKNGCGTSAASNELVVVVGGPPPGTSLTGRWFQPYTTVVCVINPGDCPLAGNRAAFSMSLELTQSATSVTGRYFAKYDDVRAISTRKEASGRVAGSVVNGVVTLVLTPDIFPTRGNFGGTLNLTFDGSRMTGLFTPAFTTADPGLPRDTVTIPNLARCPTCPPPS